MIFNSFAEIHLSSWIKKSPKIFKEIKRKTYTGSPCVSRLKSIMKKEDLKVSDIQVGIFKKYALCSAMCGLFNGRPHAGLFALVNICLCKVSLSEIQQTSLKATEMIFNKTCDRKQALYSSIFASFEIFSSIQELTLHKVPLSTLHKIFHDLTSL